MNNIDICNLLRSKKKQTELYIGSISRDWEYLVAHFTADCTEAQPLSIFDKTICGILDLDGRVHFDTLGEILGLNVKDDPEKGAYRDAAEYSLLSQAVRSLREYNMIEQDMDGYLRLTEIGKEYYSKGKKFRTVAAKDFEVYLDTTAAGHARAKAIFGKVMARNAPHIVPEFYRNEAFLKSFLHEQRPDIHDPENGNSFTNVSCMAPGKLFTVPVQIAALYDILSKETRFVAILDDKVNKDLGDVIAANAKLCEELRLAFRTHLHGNLVLPVDAAQQERFEAGILDAPATVDDGKGLAALVPPVLEPEEFWKALPFIIGEKERLVFFHLNHVDSAVHHALESFAEARPDTNVFLSFAVSDELFSKKDNLFIINGMFEGNLCCTESVTYAIRGYRMTIDGAPAYAQMVFRYPDAETDTDALRVTFAEQLLPTMYTETMVFLDREFEPTRRWVKTISRCDKRIDVFRDFLNETMLDNLQTKKRETLNRVRLAFEKTLVEEVTALLSQYNIEEIDSLKGIEDVSAKLDEIVKDTDDTYVTLQETVRPIRALIKEREMYIREEKMAKYYIIDTNVFLDDPDIISKISRRDRIVLAASVINELDKMKLKSADPERAANARKAVHAIKEQIQKDKKVRKKFLVLDTADMSLLHAEFREAKGDNYILGVAVKYREKNPFLLTSDTLFSIAAEVEKIPTLSLKEFYRKSGIAVDEKPEEAAPSEESGKTYMDVYKEIYAKKGFVLLTKFEKECRKAGITPSALGYGTFVEFVDAAPEFNLSTNQKGVTYVNLKK